MSGEGYIGAQGCLSIWTKSAEINLHVCWFAQVVAGGATVLVDVSVVVVVVVTVSVAVSAPVVVASILS